MSGSKLFAKVIGRRQARIELAQILPSILICKLSAKLLLIQFGHMLRRKSLVSKDTMCNNFVQGSEY